MCGGKGTRLDAPVEKPLFEVGGTPMVDRVRTALDDSRVDNVYAVVSGHAPATRRHLAPSSVSVVDAPGDGYVDDLGYALERVDPPVLTVVSDLPLLDGAVVDRTLADHDRGSLTTCVPAELKRQLGVGTDITLAADGRELAPTGVNVVGESDAETTRVTYDARLAVNVNRQSDAAVAAAFVRDAAGGGRS
jgi:adenosylcobinamide-phosphate guanylyltransferase